MFLYYFTNYLLVLAILVLLYMLNSSKIVIATSTITAGIITFSSILLT